MADRRVLLTVSGTIPDDLDEQVAAGRRPRADYRVIAERVGAEVVDVAAARRDGAVGRLIERLGGGGALLGWYCFRHRADYDVVLSDGEQVGLPFELLRRVWPRRRGARHAMIVHIVSTGTKRRLVRWARLAPAVDRWIVYCSRQRDVVRDDFGVDASRIELSPFQVDTEFFRRADHTDDRERALISSAGLERRDYPTLMQAVDGLDIDVVIAAASPWSKQSDSSADRRIPSNVEVRRLGLDELRDVYAASRFVVMPLYDVEFQAGITTILEAMSMERAVVCTATSGQSDTIVDGETGRYVPAGDVEAMRAAIVECLADRPGTEAMGRRARSWCVEHADVERYADTLARVVDELSDAADG